MSVQTAIEEKWNWITHGVAFLLSIVGFVLLLLTNSNKTRYSLFAILLYAISLLILYFASTAYHYSSNVVLKEKYRIMDHISIYILIAGTYSPIVLIGLLDTKGVLLFILVWSIAGFGSILKLFFTGKFEIVSIVLYLVMGWLIVLDIKALSNNVGFDGMMYVMSGGLAYTFGIIFYAFKKLNFNHVIWHLFVIAGSVFHYLFILKYIV